MTGGWHTPQDAFGYILPLKPVMSFRFSFKFAFIATAVVSDRRPMIWQLEANMLGLPGIMLVLLLQVSGLDQLLLRALAMFIGILQLVLLL